MRGKGRGRGWRESHGEEHIAALDGQEPSWVEIDVPDWPDRMGPEAMRAEMLKRVKAELQRDDAVPVGVQRADGKGFIASWGRVRFRDRSQTRVSVFYRSQASRP